MTTNEPAVEDVDEELVWLHTDLGSSYYLTRSGRVLMVDAIQPAAAPREATADEASVALVLGARNLSAPELLDLLPPRPATASDCERCRGTRWGTTPVPDAKGREIKIVCPGCAGRGWTG